jgi:hypothetical protein
MPYEAEDDDQYTIVMSCRCDGRLRYLLIREDIVGDGEVLVADDGGLIPTYASAAAAREAATRLFPPSADPEIAQLQEGLPGLMTGPDDGQPVFDIDAARRWADAPGASDVGPRALRAAWGLLARAGEVLMRPSFDPMGLAGLHMGRSSDPSIRDLDALIRTGMMLDGIVRELDRGGTEDDRWPPELLEWWTDDDAQRLAALFHQGIPGFAKRLADDVAPVEARIRERGR